MSKETILLQVEKGCLRPYDRANEEMLRERGYKIGNVLSAELRKARNPGFHRLAHAFGQLLVDNVPGFESMTAHRALKRIQIEGNIACDEVGLNFPGIGPCTYRIPQSLSYEKMDQITFEDTVRAMYDYVAKTYWPELEPEQVEGMVDLMEAACRRAAIGETYRDVK